MQLNEIKTKTPNKSKRRVGRGGKRGTYSGKGMKGQKSRAGRKMRPELRDIIKKIPKKRGYSAPTIEIKPQIVNLADIEAVLPLGKKVTPAELLSLGLIRRINGKIPAVKILGKGDIKKKIEVLKCSVSASAKEKIEKAGGSISN
ncbi:MAG: 50S ribosomal protein L15 [Parcubacteria group bacterium]|nr:50S ribosomal protein L15 [Parcubacteria group bacterium]MCR4342680.1 50S ribosomal protein L15 [Patescibacteria group bacterium]